MLTSNDLLRCDNVSQDVFSSGCRDVFVKRVGWFGGKKMWMGGVEVKADGCTSTWVSVARE